MKKEQNLNRWKSFRQYRIEFDCILIVWAQLYKKQNKTKKNIEEQNKPIKFKLHFLFREIELMLFIAIKTVNKQFYH